MIFPFRTSTIFRNRWVALLWAGGVILMASEIVDSVSGITTSGSGPAARQPAASDPGRDPPAPAPAPAGPVAPDMAAAPPIAGPAR